MKNEQNTSPPDRLTVHLDFNSSQGEFRRTLQHQLNVVTLLTVGARKVSAEEIEPQGFHNFSPAYNARLSEDLARAKAFEWLNSSFLRDSIEATDQFLGRCLSFCAAIDLSTKGLTPAELVEQLESVIPKKHQKLHFPAKIRELREKYRVQPQLAEHVLSLNRVRTCLVHRLGKVTEADTDDQGRLVAKWLSSQMVLRGLETGTQLVITQPGPGLNEKSKLEMHIVEHERIFRLGEHVALAPYDIFSTIFTLWRFGLHCADSIQAFAESAGIRILRK